LPVTISQKSEECIAAGRSIALASHCAQSERVSQAASLAVYNEKKLEEKA
jgi:hypothetical protein